MPTSPPAFARGSFGDLVGLLQAGLARSGHYTRTIDGDFGGGTDRAVRSFQADRKKTVDGRATPPIWEAATGLPWPDLFERCLQLTARFEGHGYKLIAGNFDGAGVTWGIIGFTLQHGEVQAIINEIAARAPQLLDVAFGSANAADLLDLFRTASAAKLLAWASSISTGANKQTVVEPWRSGFSSLGGQPLVQEIQRRRARERYFDKAIATARRLDLMDERGIALCFDVHVQNGGVKKADEASYQQELAKPGGPKTPAACRVLLATLVADSARKKYRDDVFSRKNTIATGEGIVHEQFFKLDNWGFAGD